MHKRKPPLCKGRGTAKRWKGCSGQKKLFPSPTLSLCGSDASRTRACRPLPCLREGEGGPTERDCEAIAFRRGKGFASAGSEPLLEDKIKNKRGTPLWLPLIREGLRLCTLHKRGTLYTFPRRKHSVGFAFFFLVLFLFSREKRKRTRPPTQLSRMFLIRSSIRSFRLELRAMRSSTRSMAWCTVE